MASNFKRFTQQAIGVTATAIENYVVAASTQVTVIGLSLANVTSSPITATISLVNNGAVKASLVKDAPIPPGSALVVVGGDQKLVLMANDSIKVTSSAAASIDAVMSVLEVA